MISPMLERKSRDRKQPRQKADARHTWNPPTDGAKNAAAAENAAKSSESAAIPPEKLNAENDK
jgi:hypothetical protein